MKAVRGTFPAGGVRGKSLADVYLANQGLEELADCVWGIAPPRYMAVGPDPGEPGGI